MGDAEKVRASRDGDKFHYFWAARRALHLLDMTGDLKVVGVEGLPQGEQVVGEEVIDVAEYYGGHDMITCTSLRYAQLKHSTLRTDELIVASELENTLNKFAKVYRQQVPEKRTEKLHFVFVANRSLNDKVKCSLQELTDGATVYTFPREAGLLRSYMGFDGDVEHERDFCRRFTAEDGSPGLKDMEQLLGGDLKQFLPGGGTGTEMAQLMETVSRCATSLVDKQTLEIGDVLVALRTDEDELFPAPNAIEKPTHAIRTRDIDRVTAELTNGMNNKVLLTAFGGVGKSVLTSMLNQELPAGSVTVVYDCFAGGDYRQATSARHEHRTGLTQISNELAAKGMCTPLIPTQANDSSYMRVFMRRVQYAAEQLGREEPGALLTVIIDAADNAAMAAAEQRHNTFVTDLFREEWPINSRLVQLCRPERQELLRAPRTGVTVLRLAGFQQSESLEHLRTRFPQATADHGAELHALTDGNPRVQAMAMENAESVAEALSSIQLARDAPGSVLDSLFAKQVGRVSDEGHLRADELDRLCEALATLHPPMPLDDLATIAGVHVDAIRSFAVALGRGLHAAGNTLQFRDEPTETWFREAYGLSAVRKQEFAQGLKPLAARSPYVASALPQLLFEADLLNELVDLALSDAGLPGIVEELQAQEIARSRARFALCAMLRCGRNADAALLAVKAGDMSSGHSRKLKMFRTHTDLAARFLSPDVVDALCSSRELATDWPGSSLHTEAALLSWFEPFSGMARGRLRTAFNNVVAILRLPEDERRSTRYSIDANVVADLAMAATNLDGPDGGSLFLQRWRHNSFVRRVTSKLCARLADSGRDSDLNGLVVASKERRHMQVAVAETMYEYNIVPSGQAIKALVKMLRRRTKPYKELGGVDQNEPDIRGVVWTLVHALKAGVLNTDDALRVLDIHLPEHLPDRLASRISARPTGAILLGHALRARLTGDDLTIERIVDPQLRKAISKNNSSHDERTQEFHANIPRLLPWASCWLEALLNGDNEHIRTTFNALAAKDLKPSGDYDPPLMFFSTAADMATRILAVIPQTNLIERLTNWCNTEVPLLRRARLTVAQTASRSPHLESLGLQVVLRGIELAQQDRTDADSRVESLIALARTLVAVNESEARAIFDMAVAEAEQVGDDLYARWQSIVNTANALATGTEPARAQRLFQIAEALEKTGTDLHQVELAEHLRAMHKPSYFALTSQARDRRTLDFGLMLTPGFNGAADSPRERLACLSLYAFNPQAGWNDPVSNLSLATAATASRILADFTRYERTADQVPPDPAPTRSRYFDTVDDPPPDPSIQFADSDFTTEQAWKDALHEYRWHSTERSQLIAFAIDKHPTRRPEVLDAFSRSQAATEADFVELAKVASQCRPTPALTAAQKRLALVYSTRFARQICTRYYRNDNQLPVIAEATGTAVSDLNALAFEELGRSAHKLNYRDYFLLAAHLANTLDARHAGEVFDATALLFEDLAPPEEQPSPPADSTIALAGTIWTALGDIDMKVRWQAAHAVVLLVRFECTAELAALAGFAAGIETTAPFLDARFPFYALHARMWLLLALARASREPNAATLASFASWLADVVRGPHHAVNQVLAQQTLAELVARARVTLGEMDAEVLTVRVVAEEVEMDRKQRKARANPLKSDDEGDEHKPSRHLFFYDFEKNWCYEVAAAFESTKKDVARRASQIAAKFDGYEIFEARTDPRSTASVYDRRTRHMGHADWQGEDDLSFYIAIHSLLTVGAELAEANTAYREPDSTQGAYMYWLRSFLPERPDGRWLADRRDPPPIPAPDLALASYHSKEHWPWSLTKSDFERVAGLAGDAVTVWGNFDSTHGGLSEDVLVQSSLVPHETARSLLITLQTSPTGPYSFSMPTTDEEVDGLEDWPFELTPWLHVSDHRRGIDERDERAHGVWFPPVRPSTNIINKFGLVPDEDARAWFHEGSQVFWSRIWSNMTSAASDREQGTSGQQLQADLGFLTTMLQRLDMTLALHVGMCRRISRPSYERRRNHDDEFDWPERSGKIYLLDPGGHWLEY